MTLQTIVLQTTQQGGGMPMILMIVVLFAIMWFFMIRPQNKKQKEIQNFRNNLTLGQEVITSGGIYGKVKEIRDEDNTLTLEIASGVKVKVDRNSVFSAAPTGNAAK